MAGVAATVAIGTVAAPVPGLTGAAATAVTIFGGVVVGYVEDLARKRFLD